MKRLPIVVALLVVLSPAASVHANGPAAPEPISVSAESDWPWWRGPTHDGIAHAGQKPPHEWSSSKNVLWKSPISGRGHGSPIVVGKQVLILTADLKADTQTLYCFDRDTGKTTWKKVVHSTGVYKGGNKKASQASTTPACDGKRIYITLLNQGAIYVSARDLSGEPLWQTKISNYIVHQGYGASPYLYKSLVIVAADNKGGGAICGLERATGKIVWRVDRPKKPNYPSPTVIHVAGKDQLILTGCDLVTSIDPLTGKKNWEFPGATTECVTTTVTDGKHIYTSGGYPKNHVSAVVADGSGKVTWKNGSRVYVPSMISHDGHLYAVTDAGVATCWNAATGKTAWKGRLGGTFSSSPVLAGGHVFATNEKGQSFVFAATPEKFDLVAKNEITGQVFASPAICGGRIYLRIAERQNGKRQEVLYCLANGK